MLYRNSELLMRLREMELTDYWSLLLCLLTYESSTQVMKSQRLPSKLNIYFIFPDFNSSD